MPARPGVHTTRGHLRGPDQCAARITFVQPRWLADERPLRLRRALAIGERQPVPDESSLLSPRRHLLGHPEPAAAVLAPVVQPGRLADERSLRLRRPMAISEWDGVPDERDLQPPGR